MNNKLIQLSGQVCMTINVKFRFILSGSLGQLGVEVARFLRDIYGRENVIMSDIIKPRKEVFNDGAYTLSFGSFKCVFLS